MISSSCASHTQSIDVQAPPDYLSTPCTFPEPRDVETNADMAELLTDFYNALSDCDMKHSLLLKYISTSMYYTSKGGK